MWDCGVSLNLGVSAIRGIDIRGNQCGVVGSAFFKASFFLRKGLCLKKSVWDCGVSLNLGLSAIRGKDIRENKCGSVLVLSFPIIGRQKFPTFPFPTPSDNPGYTTDKRSTHLCRPNVVQIVIHPDRF